MSSSVTASPEQKQQESFTFEEGNAAPNTSDLPESNNNNEQPAMRDTAPEGQPCIKLKGSLVPMTALELSHYNLDQIRRDLKEKTSQAPDFFENLPVIISLEKFDENEALVFNDLIAACLEHSIKVVAVRGGSEHHQAAAKLAGLGVLAKQKERQAEPVPSEPAATATETVEVVKTVVQKERQISKIVHHPVRSGQQVYASDGDLIVMASVSAGAEILADGNIHVYGALRGRALAGVKGDTSARIFCHSLEAELVSVAGQYKISEDIDKSVLRKPAQVFLDKDALKFREIEY